MSQIWVYSLVSVLVVSLVSLIGIIALAFQSDKLKNWLLYLVSFSAGALLGDVFLHVLPEIAEDGFPVQVGMYILLGILIFFGLERYIWWHHSHSEHSEDVHSMSYMILLGDGLHNFIDGLIIASSYLVSVPVGVATTLAVVFHEVPQELGNFAVLVHGGWSAKKALFYNFLSALAAALGAVVVLFFTRNLTEVPLWLVGLAASSFIYIAMSDLIPELQRNPGRKSGSLLILWFVLGISAMGLLLLLG